MSTFGQRLRRAIDQWWQTRQNEVEGKVGDLRVLQRELRKQLTGGKAGTSYQSLLNYSDPANDSLPTVEWITAAAGILGVRPEWLAFDSGEMTEAAERRAREKQASQHRRGKGWARGQELRRRRPGLMSGHPSLGPALRSFDELLDSVSPTDAPWAGSDEARLFLLEGAAEFLHTTFLVLQRLVTSHRGGPYRGEDYLVSMPELREALREWFLNEEWRADLEAAVEGGTGEEFLDAALGEFLGSRSGYARHDRQRSLAASLGATAWAVNNQKWSRDVLSLFADRVYGLGVAMTPEDRAQLARELEDEGEAPEGPP